MLSNEMITATQARNAAHAFDYSTLEPYIATSLRASAEAIREGIQRTTHDIIETGRALKGARDRLDHGQFTAWIESEIGIAPRTAQAYLSAAALADNKGATVAVFPPATLYRLASKSAPAEVVDAVLSRASAGEVLSDKTVADMLAEARHEQRKAAAREESAARSRRMPKRKREQREAEQRQRDEQRECDRQATAAAATAIRERFAADDLAFLIEQLSAGFGALDVLHALQNGGAE